MFSFPRDSKGPGGAGSSHAHTCTLRPALAGPSHCASTLFLQGACESVPESLPVTQEGSASRLPGTMSPLDTWGLGCALSGICGCGV